MFGKIGFKKGAILSAIIFILFAGNSRREASAFSIQPDGVSSEFSEENQSSVESLAEFPPSFISMNDQSYHHHRSEKEEDRSYQNTGHTGSDSHFNPDSIFGKDSSNLNLIKGDFCLIGLDHNDWFSHFPFDKDDFPQGSSPSPVPLSAAALFFGTGLMILTGLTFRFRFVN
jgi:hypothetical protein